MVELVSPDFTSGRPREVASIEARGRSLLTSRRTVHEYLGAINVQLIYWAGGW
jgi:hypothetical protein